MKAKRVRVTIGRVVVNPELLTAEAERHMTQVQVILVTSIMATMLVGHMQDASNHYQVKTFIFLIY